MRGWLFANAFFVGLAVIAAGLLLTGWVFFVKALHLDPEPLRVAIGCWSVGAVILTGVAGKYILKFFDR